MLKYFIDNKEQVLSSLKTVSYSNIINGYKLPFLKKYLNEV